MADPPTARPAPGSVLRLPDGRSLGFSDHGEGPPVLYFHGWPSCRLEAALIDGLPVRLIAVDRPGYGASSPQRGRRLIDWPDDVAAVADHLGLGRFHVVGVSGGAPYALACAARLDRVASIALVGPLPPLAGKQAADPPALGEALRRLLWLGRHPVRGWAVMAGVRLGVGLGLLRPLEMLDRTLTGPDAAAFTPALRRQMVQVWHEALRRGVAGAASDARIYAGSWGFDLAAIATPATIWHGAADNVVPEAALSGYGGLRASRRILEGEGHFSLPFTRAAEILSGLLADAAEVAYSPR